MRLSIWLWLTAFRTARKARPFCWSSSHRRSSGFSIWGREMAGCWRCYELTGAMPRASRSIFPRRCLLPRERFRGDEKIQVVEHNLDNSLPELGRFDVIVSSFAIHHCADERKRALYSEIYAALSPGGIFCNLEHVAPPTAEIHARFLRSLGITEEEEDPSNKLVSVETQVQWLREIGFQDVDCHWKWLELALLGETKRR